MAGSQSSKWYNRLGWEAMLGKARLSFLPVKQMEFRPLENVSAPGSCTNGRPASHSKVLCYGVASAIEAHAQCSIASTAFKECKTLAVDDDSALCETCTLLDQRNAYVSNVRQKNKCLWTSARHASQVFGG
jgi:hypothetical protein